MQTKNNKNDLIFPELLGFTDGLLQNKLSDAECFALLVLYGQKKVNITHGVRKHYFSIPKVLFPILDVAWPHLVSTDSLISKIKQYSHSPNYGLMLEQIQLYINSRDCSNPFRYQVKEWLQGNIKWINGVQNFLELNQKLQDLNLITEVKKPNLGSVGSNSEANLFKLALLSSQLVGVFGSQLSEEESIPLDSQYYFPILHEFISVVDVITHWSKALFHYKSKEFKEAVAEIDQCIEKDANLRLYYFSAKEIFLEAMNNTKEIAKFCMQVGHYKKALSLQLELITSDTKDEDLKHDLQVARYFTNENNTYSKIVTQKNKNPLDFDDVWLNLTENNFAPVLFHKTTSKLVAIKLIDGERLYRKVDFDYNEVNNLYIKMLDVDKVSDEACKRIIKLGNDILKIIGNDAYFNHQSFLVLASMIAVLKECNTDGAHLFELIENALSLYKFNSQILYLYSYQLSQMKKFSRYPLLETKRIYAVHQSLRYAMLFASEKFNDFLADYENDLKDIMARSVPLYASEYNQKQILTLLNKIKEPQQKVKIAQVLRLEMEYVIKNADIREFVAELNTIVSQNKRVRIHKDPNEKNIISSDKKNERKEEIVENKENEKIKINDKKVVSQTTETPSSSNLNWWLIPYVSLALLPTLLYIVTSFWRKSNEESKENNELLTSFIKASASNIELVDDPNPQTEIIDLGLVRAEVNLHETLTRRVSKKHLDKKTKTKQLPEKKSQSISEERLSKEEEIDDKTQIIESSTNSLASEKTRLYIKFAAQFESYENLLEKFENLLEKFSKLNLKDSYRLALEYSKEAIFYINNPESFGIEIIRIAGNLKQTTDELKAICEADYVKDINDDLTKISQLKEEFRAISDENQLRNLEANLEVLSTRATESSKKLAALEKKIESLRNTIISQNNNLLHAVKESSKTQKPKKTEASKSNKGVQKKFKSSHGLVSGTLNDESSPSQQNNTSADSKKREELTNTVEIKDELHLKNQQTFEEWCQQVKKMRQEVESENKAMASKKIIPTLKEKSVKDEKLSTALFHAKMLQSFYHALLDNTFMYTSPVLGRAALLHAIRMMFAISLSSECKKDKESFDIANLFRNKLVYGWYKILNPKHKNIFQQFVSLSDTSLLYTIVKIVLPKIENILAEKIDNLNLHSLKKRSLYQSLTNLTEAFTITDTIDYIVDELELIKKLNAKLQKALLNTSHKTQVDSIVMSLTLVGQLGRSIHFDHHKIWLRLKETTPHSQFYSIKLLEQINDLPDSMKQLKEVFYKELVLLKEIADKKRNYFNEGYTPLLNLLIKLAGDEYSYKLFKRMSLLDFLNLCNEIRKIQYHDLSDPDNVLGDVFVFEKLSSHFIYDLIQIIPVHLNDLHSLQSDFQKENKTSPGR